MIAALFDVSLNQRNLVTLPKCKVLRDFKKDLHLGIQKFLNCSVDIKKLEGGNMRIFPAIDLRGGQVVRLIQGDYDQMTVYATDPVEIVKRFKEAGASYLHIVDLDGAKDGRPVNFEAIRSIVAQGGFFTQVGGGIRDEDKINKYLELGIDRVILGTVAVRNFEFLKQMVTKYQEKIAVGVDAKNGFVAVNGWLEVTEEHSVDFCQRLADIGVRTVIYTDIAKDGEGKGTNLGIYETLNKIKGLDIIASGGITFESEITRLNEMGIYGAILGKALYTGKLDLKQAIALARNQ